MRPDRYGIKYLLSHYTLCLCALTACYRQNVLRYFGVFQSSMERIITVFLHTSMEYTFLLEKRSLTIFPVIKVRH